MGADLRIEGSEKLGALSEALRRYGVVELEQELFDGIVKSVEPLVEAVKKSLKNYLPDRYAEELARTLVDKAVRLAGTNPGVRLTASAKTGRGKQRDLASLNRGRLRHPLYGNREWWFDQEVKKGFWDEPLIDESDAVRAELVKVLDDIAGKLAAKL
jgi:hypothetical protein